MYDVAVHMSKHPDLNSYVADTCAVCRTLLHHGALERLVLVICGPDGAALERYCLDVRNMASACTLPHYTLLLHPSRCLQCALLSVTGL
jgi:hypothetical protein